MPNYVMKKQMEIPFDLPPIKANDIYAVIDRNTDNIAKTVEHNGAWMITRYIIPKLFHITRCVRITNGNLKSFEIGMHESVIQPQNHCLGYKDFNNLFEYMAKKCPIR